MVLCTTVTVMPNHKFGSWREMVMCAAFNVMVFNVWWRRREILMCAAISVMVCYTKGEREGNGDECCS